MLGGFGYSGISSISSFRHNVSNKEPRLPSSSTFSRRFRICLSSAAFWIASCCLRTVFCWAAACAGLNGCCEDEAGTGAMLAVGMFVLAGGRAELLEKPRCLGVAHTKAGSSSLRLSEGPNNLSVLERSLVSNKKIVFQTTNMERVYALELPTMLSRWVNRLKVKNSNYARLPSFITPSTVTARLSSKGASFAATFRGRWPTWTRPMFLTWMAFLKNQVKAKHSVEGDIYTCRRDFVARELRELPLRVRPYLLVYERAKSCLINQKWTRPL